MVDLILSSTFISKLNKNLFNRKGLKSFRSFLRNKATSGDKYLESLGFTVLRFENRFVFQDPDYIKSEIRKVFNQNNEYTAYKNQPPRPH